MNEWEKEYKWLPKINEDEFCNRECYEFNERLKSQFDDDCCEHCKKYLTIQCEHLEDFQAEIEDLSDYE